MNMDWIEELAGNAAAHFWEKRDGGKGVQGGKTMDGFVKLLEKAIESTGLNGLTYETSMRYAAIPGYFRAAKNWDFIALKDGKLVVAIEFKSQIGSVGNNGNNRIEESLGSAIDLQTTLEEEVLPDSGYVFSGYLMLAEDCPAFHKTPKISMKHFPPMSDFLLDPGLPHTKKPDGTFPEVVGISYINRYDLLCQRSVFKHLYTAAALVTVSSAEGSERVCGSASPQSSLKTFLLKLINHCEVLVSLEEQNR